ncbi:hypothetical protein QTI33_08290 [Variovorax sp. J22P271]|nr:hypothetical protein [Variovorax sp. J22P271]
MIASTVGSALSAGAKAGMGVATTVVGGAATAAAGTAANRTGDDASSGPMAYMTDSLFRKDPGATAASGGTSQTDASQATTDRATAAEVGRIFATALRTGTLSPEDHRYASQVVAQRTGLSQQDAERRVTDVYSRAKAALDETKSKANEMADAARKTTAYGSLWIFLSLILGALFAAYCATLGGRQRDL